MIEPDSIEDQFSVNNTALVSTAIDQKSIVPIIEEARSKAKEILRIIKK